MSNPNNTSIASMACRGCLAVGVNLYSMKKSRLVDNYVQLVGISIQDQYSQFLCSICVTMLRKFAAFRDKCCRSYQFLVDADLQGNSIRRLKLPYTLTKTQILDYDGLTDNEHDFLREVIQSHEAKGSDDYVLQATENGLLVIAESDEYKEQIEVEIKTERIETDYVVDNVADEAMDDNITNASDDAAVDRMDDEEIGTDEDEEMDDYALESEDEVDKNKDSHKKQIIKPSTDEQIIEFGKTYGFSVKFLTEEEQYEEMKQIKLKVNKQGVKCEQCGHNCTTRSFLDKHYQLSHNKNFKFACKFCESRFSANYLLTRHLIKHKIVYSCNQCRKTTKRVGFLPSHSLTHKGKNYKCEYCNRIFVLSKSYRNHVKHQHASVLPWCDLCGISFVTNKGILYHKLKEHNGLVAEFSCEECSVKFCSEHALEKHVRLKLCDWASCVQCGEGFPNEQMLRFHLLCHQGDVKEHACKACGVNFNNMMALKRHSDNCSIEVPCVQCGSHFVDAAAMLDHVEDVHNTTNGYTCPECEKTFPNAVSYKFHISNAHFEGNILQSLLESHRDKLYKCSRCNQRFENVFEYKVHSEKHRQDRSFECDYCNVKCKKKYDLMLHIRRHTGEFNFKCNVCHRSFLAKSDLKQHMTSHSTDRPYQCVICKNYYKKKNHLRGHMIIHSDVKPYACTHCEMKFKTNSELKSHSVKHSDEKPHKCSFCDQKFKYSDCLTKHMLRHTGETPYKCTECPKQYTRRSTLKNHLMKEHGKEMPKGRIKVKNVKCETTVGGK